MTQENSEQACICKFVGGPTEGVVIINPDCPYDHGQPSQPAGAAPAVSETDYKLAIANLEQALAAERAARERAEGALVRGSDAAYWMRRAGDAERELATLAAKAALADYAIPRMCEHLRTCRECLAFDSTLSDCDCGHIQMLARYDALTATANPPAEGGE